MEYPLLSKRLTKSPKERQYHSSASWRHASSVSAGKGESPQLPETSVVMPWKSLEAAELSCRKQVSEWACESMKPGAATRPPQSVTRFAALPRRSPMPVIRSPYMEISPGKASAPVPSMIVQFLRIRSSMAVFLHSVRTLRVSPCLRSILPHRMFCRKENKNGAPDFSGALYGFPARAGRCRR